jgi:nucleotide-binding universal stress UspA family protein
LFKNILVPLDGSKYSQLALETAIELAKQFQSNITLIHVNSLSAITPLNIYENTKFINPDKLVNLISTTREVGFNILAQGKKKVEAHKIPVKTKFKEGHVVQEILTTTREGHFDLIIMGAKGISKIKEISIGSVSEKVLRNAPCSVMVLKTRMTS